MCSMPTSYQVDILDEIKKFIPKNTWSDQLGFDDILETYQDSETSQKIQESTKLTQLDMSLREKIWNI